MTKSRSNWHVGWNDGQYEKIFGSTKAITKTKGNSHRTIKLTMDASDGPNMKQIIKVGHEINRMKKLDGMDSKRIDKYFKADCDKLISKPFNPQIVNDITRDITRVMKGVK